MANKYPLSSKSKDTVHLPTELREILDLLAAYGRKMRLAAEANGEQQKKLTYQKVIAEANEFLSRMEKEEKHNGRSA